MPSLKPNRSKSRKLSREALLAVAAPVGGRLELPGAREAVGSPGIGSPCCLVLDPAVRIVARAPPPRSRMILADDSPQLPARC